MRTISLQKLILGAALTAGFYELHAQVLINEYSCSNINSYTDNFGNYEDWIELYNNSSSAVNLSGYHLSEKKTNVQKWTFGNVSIPANGRLRVWASGADVNSGTNLHTNFSLTQCKPDMIVLSNPSGNIIDSLTLKTTQAGHSRGRTTDGASTWSVFLAPTPNAANSNAFQEYAAMPLMNVAAGFYSSSKTVTITSASPSVTIHYTTNGITPNAGSPTYSGPVTVSATTVLRAIAISSNSNVPKSFVESNTYFINSPHTVTVISVFGDQVNSLMSGNQINPETGIEYFDSSGTFRTEGYGTSNKHGNDSWSYPQRGIDYICEDGYGYNYALLHRMFNSKARTEFQRVILKAAANDNYPFENPGNPSSWGPPTQLGAAHIRDAFVQTLSQKANLHMDARTWAPCVMYVNGQYWGVYDLREKVDDKDYTNYYYNTKEDSLQMLKTWGNTWSDYGGAQAQTDWNSLVNYVNTNGLTNQANYNYVDNLYSFKSLADYVILNSLCLTSDWLNWNTEWWRATNVSSSKQKWRYNLWDEDATFGHYINYTGIPNLTPSADPCDPQSLGNPGGQGHVLMLNAALQNPTFKQYYVMRYFDLLNGPLSCSRMVTILDSMTNIISPEMQKHVTRWGGTVNQWKQNVQTMKNFIMQRCDSVKQHFNGCYNTSGPYAIKVDVYPPGAGTIDFNSNHLTSFAWYATYPGNMNINMQANSNNGYCFSHWAFKNNTPIGSVNDSAVSVNLAKTDTIVAYFIHNVKPTITPANAKVCAGDSVKLTGASSANYNWQGNNMSCTNCATPVVRPTATSVYTLTVNYTSTGCSNSNTTTVTVVPYANASYTYSVANNTVLPENVTAVNTSSNSVNAYWNFGNGQLDTGMTATASYHTPGTYTITMIALGNNNCNDTITEIIVVNDTAGLVMPNVFTPNGDGINDYFQPKSNGMSQLSCTVFNRWGQQVYEFSSATDKWNGNNCSEGTYFYVLTAEDKNTKQYKLKGYITLLR